ncbi:MAG: DUF1684 domain-containing protein [Betaproteobacteria bacterium]
MSSDSRRAAALVLAIAVLGLATACSNRPPEDKDYASEIAAARAEKDAAFMNSSDSPVPPNRRSELLPLAYFPIDPDYSVPAILRPAADNAVMQMPTSTGQVRQMRRVGSLEFTLKGQPLKLTAFVEVGAPDLNHLFVPFTDLTTGTETYAAGRYLDLDRNATGIYVIDFNTAYQPYCYFNSTYDCPYPPPENRLKIPIRAGEKLKHSER